MRSASSLVLASLLAVLPAAAQSGPRSLAEQYLFNSVNAERAANGLAPLAWNAPLQAAATYHAQQMRSTRTLSHQLSGEPDLTARAAHFGTRFSKVAENVAVGQSILQMHDALMRSPHHRENILDPAVDTIAVSVVSNRGELWAVEDFAHDVASLTLQQQESHVAARLGRLGMPAGRTEAARATCEKDSGYEGTRPGFVMRYTTADLDHLPGELLSRIQTGLYTNAAVGACPPDSGGFSSYSIALLLYR